ncbi:MAG: FtsX-like permease family protein [Phycisphaerae bacterium]
MTGLAWANIKHRKLRSALAALAVAIGVAMLVTMLALSHGTLDEVAQRVKGIDAELLVLPSETSAIFSEGAPLSEKYLPKIKNLRVNSHLVVTQIIPVYFQIMPKMAGQQQRVFGIEPDQFQAFSKGRSLLAGRLFDPEQRFKKFIEQLPKSNQGHYQPDQVPDKVLNEACELVIDERLSRAGKYKVGDTIPFLGRNFTICGIIQAGAAGRVFAPIEVIRHIGTGGIPRSSLFFVKLDPTLVDVEEKEVQGDKIRVWDCAAGLGKIIDMKVISLNQYDKLLFNSFGPIYVYINIASGLVLVVSFLFIMVTIYTMVLERRREIGILRSLGATGSYIMSQTISEALIISVCGMAAGLAMSYGAKEAIERFRPLLTVDLQPRWLLLGVIVGFVGGLASALYPGYCALRQDPLEALGYE